MKDLGAGLLAIVSGVLGLAMIAVLVSRNAATASVIKTSGSALAGVIQAAVAPVSTPGVGQSGASLTPASFSSGLFGGLGGSGLLA